MESNLDFNFNSQILIFILYYLILIQYLNFAIAFVACWSQEFFETIFAIEIAFLFNKTNILQWTSTAAIYTDKMIGTPNFTQGSDEWSSVLQIYYNK